MASRLKEGSFCWFECACRQVDQVRDFYTNLFGWEAVQSPMPGEQGGIYTLFKIDGADIAGLFELGGPMFEGVPSHWGVYIAADDIDAKTEQAKSLGAKILYEPMDIPGVARISGFQDPTGAVIALFRAGDHCGSFHFGDIPNSFCWGELSTRDTAAAEKFYSSLLPWELKHSQIPGMTYTEFMLEGRPIGGITELPAERGEAPPYWLPYVVVEDCDAIGKRVTELGGQLIVPPMDIPNTGRFTVFQDPGGAVLAVIKLEMP